ncbi:putative sphingolipid C4-monooxygenase [Helianthus debilis subsp. tardiflorus]
MILSEQQAVQQIHNTNKITTLYSCLSETRTPSLTSPLPTDLIHFLLLTLNLNPFNLGFNSPVMVFWEGYVSDEVMGTFAPIVIYWLYAGLFQLLPPLDNYRLHTRKEEDVKNSVPLSSVVKGVLLQQLVQAVVAHLLFLVTSETGLVESEVQPPLLVQIIQIIIAMFVMDTWQYFVHRYMHVNKFLYRHIHSQHHKLVVPYAIGALYNHPLEGLLLDTVGGAISFLISGMTARTAVIFFCFAVVKTVDDHCGLWLPGNLFHMFFQNNTAYHDIHHQLHGLKYNFSQPFFPIWDKLLGTHMPYDLVKRPEGGFEARLSKD